MKERLTAERAALLAVAEQAGISTVSRPIEPGPCASEVARALRYSFVEQTTGESDVFPLSSAIATAVVSATDPVTGDEVGYLKVSYTTERLAELSFPTVMHYLRAKRGWCFDPDNPAEAWLRAHLHARKAPASMAGQDRRPASLTDTDVPTAEVISADLVALGSEYESEISDWVSWAVVPYVAYARSNRPGHGIGSALYEMMGIELAKSGRVLRASSIQNDDAKGLWARLAGAGTYPVVEVSITHAGEEKTHPALDYRAPGV